MPCNLDLYPLEFTISQANTGTDAIAAEVDDLQYTAEAIAISLLQNQRAYGYNLSMLQDAIGGGGLNALMPLTIISNTAAFIPNTKGSKGFWGGGMIANGSSVSYLDRFTFADKSISRLGVNFAKPRCASGTTATRINAYWGGGWNVAGGGSTDLDRLILSTEALSTVGTLFASPPNPTGHIVGLTALTAGYMLGGVCTNYTRSNSIQKITFSTEAVTILGAVLPTAPWGHVGVSAATAGYIAGGYLTQSVATIYKFLYSTEVISLLGAPLAVARRNSAALSSETAGYFTAGLGGTGYVGDGTILSSIEKLTYPSEAMSLLGAAFGIPHWVSEGLGSNSYGYTGGGFIRPYASLRTIYEFAYIGESLTLLGIGLSDVRYSSSAVSDFSPAMGL